MPTTVVLTFPWGRYHANPWGSHVNEGAVEWPPSPWRLLRALYAVWRCRAPELDAELVAEVLASLAALPDFALPPSVDAHTRHYLPDGRGGSDKGVDAFAVIERDAPVEVTWPVELDERARRALTQLLELLPYLGRADSICEARLAEPGEPLRGAPCHPLRSGDVANGKPIRLLAPRLPLDVEALVARPVDVRRAGLVEPPGAYWQAYSPLPAVLPPSGSAPRSRRLTRRPNAVRWAIHAPARPSIRAAVSMTDVLRQACMSKVGDPPSELLAGKDAHGARLEGHRHAHYLAFDDECSRRLTHMVVWVPGGLQPKDLSALAGLDRLWGRPLISDFRPVRLGLEAIGDISVVAPQLVGPSARWESHTPFAPPRHAKRGTSWGSHIETQVAEELARRGRPEPSSIRARPGDWLSFRRHRISERLVDARRAVGVEIVFSEPVVGPIALGALSHFGLGLFLPADPGR